MIELQSLRSVELREKLIEVILETLACLPESRRNIFVWNHYRGCSVQQIGEMLDWRPSEVEAALDAISSILLEQTRGLLGESGAATKHFPKEGIRSSLRIKTAEARSCDRAPEALLFGGSTE